MKVHTAGRKQVLRKELVWLDGRLRCLGTIDISGWYTVFDLRGRFDLILGKDWMEENPHFVNHGDNTLSLLEAD